MELLPLLDGQVDPTSKWLVICLALLTIIYAVLRPMFRKKDPLAKPAAFSSLAQQRAVEKQMQNVLVELSQMARQISAQLDTRSTKLELLIKEADQKLLALRAVLQQGPQTPASPTETDVPQIDPQHAEVYQLADQGRSPVEIAQQLARPRGEIELILALRR